MVGNGEVGIATELHTAPHELVHASRKAAGLTGNPFFEEGLAETLRGGEFAGYGIADDAANDPLSPVDLSTGFESSVAAYITAGHFVSWLRDDLGDDVLFRALTSAAYVDNAAQIDTWFEAALGASLEETTQRWRTESARSYWQPGPCEAARSLGSGTVVEGELDCSQEDTIGVLGGGSDNGGLMFSQRLCLDLGAAAQVEVALQADPTVSVSLTRLDGDGQPLESGRVAGGETSTLDGSGSWLLFSVESSGDGPLPYRVELRPLP